MEYNECCIVQDMLITLYIFHKSCPYESRLLSNNNRPTCMIKIVLDSVKNRYNVRLTDHTTNGLARSSLSLSICFV